MEVNKGELFEWILEDKNTVLLERVKKQSKYKRKNRQETEKLISEIFQMGRLLEDDMEVSEGDRRMAHDIIDTISRTVGRLGDNALKEAVGVAEAREIKARDMLLKGDEMLKTSDYERAFMLYTRIRPMLGTQ